ncbi:hypothetical protein CN448_24175 [Bacillus cereus]|uniref:dihydrofolate reductase n=1 Tax=Bacillus cereus TaxID=1396 RepID=UPI000BF4E504|nr:hypothetical protein CN448_24175 [Bacillus cereus]
MKIDYFYLIDVKFVLGGFDYIQFRGEQLKDKDFVVIVSQQTYKLFLPIVSHLYSTRIHNTHNEVDSYFPMLDSSEWSTKIQFYYKKVRIMTIRSVYIF